MLQQTSLTEYFKVTSSSQRSKQVKHEIKPKKIQAKRKEHVNVLCSKKTLELFNDESVSSNNLTEDIEIIGVKNMESEEVQTIDVKTAEYARVLKKDETISFSEKDTSMTIYSQPTSPKKSRFSNRNASPKKVVLQSEINTSSQSNDATVIANCSQFTNSKWTISPKSKDNIDKTPKIESTSPKSITSPRKSYTPKKSSPLKRSFSANRVNRKLFSEIIDWQSTVETIENLNLAKQGAIRANDFNLKEIYETNSFRFSYSDINPTASTKYDISDIVMPKETNAAYLFMIIVNVLSSPMNCGYFDESELDMIFSILKLSEKAQMLLVRMLRRKRSWHRSNLLKYPEIGDNLQPIFEELVSQCLCSSDIESEDMSVILNLLQVDEIRKICQELKLPGIGKKDINISQLLKLSNTSKPLFPGMKSPTSALHKRSIAKLGYCVRLTKKILDVFDRIVALLIPNLDAEKSISDIFLMFYNIREGSTTYPTEYSREHFPIFSDKNHLVSYVEARRALSEILIAIDKKNWEMVREKGQFAYERVSVLSEIGFQSDNNSTLPDYVKRYMPAYTWLKIMSKSIDAFKKSSDTLPQAELFLRTLLDQQCHMHWRKGEWYAELILIKTYHRKEMEAAADIIIEALHRKDNFTDVHKIEIAKKADKLVKRKTGGICADSKMKIHRLLEDISNQAFFNFKPACNTIHANLVRGNFTSQKSVWILDDSSDSQIYASVENLALHHYRHDNYCNGIHCEGALPVTLFAILFWEELYSIKIPGVWLSAYQSAPEDLCSVSFYHNRKAQIDLKLDTFRHLSSEVLSDIMEDKFNMYCKYTSLIHSNVFKNSNDIKEIVQCLGTDAVIRICKRLIADFKSWRSGFPDLMVWNPETKKYKIVEVKGPGDSLSTKQELWLEYLHQLGLNAEVCIVKGK